MTTHKKCCCTKMDVKGIAKKVQQLGYGFLGTTPYNDLVEDGHHCFKPGNIIIIQI